MRFAPIEEQLIRSPHYVVYTRIDYWEVPQLPYPNFNLPDSYTNPTFLKRAFDGWEIDASWSDSTDTVVRTATIRLQQRDQYNDSLAPTMSGYRNPAYDGIIETGKLFAISTQVKSPGEPEGGLWYNQFYGYIDKVEYSGDTIVLTLRDVGSRILDRYIEEEKTYAMTPEGYEGTWLGEPMEDIIDQILTDNGFWGTNFLYPITNANVGPFLQRMEPVLTAVNNLAKQIGYNVKFEYPSYNESDGLYALRLINPERERLNGGIPLYLTDINGGQGSISVSPEWDFELSPSEYTVVRDINLDYTYIRNKISIMYIDKTDPNNPINSEYIGEDVNSQILYGFRWMRISEGDTSVIDSEVEAKRLADAALNDLSQPVVAMTIELPYFWIVQVGDLIKFAPNNYHHGDYLYLSVLSFSHNLKNNSYTTTISCRGSISSAYAKWLKKDPYNQRVRTYDPLQLDDPNYNVFSGEIKGIPSGSKLRSNPMFTFEPEPVSRDISTKPVPPYDNGQVSGQWESDFSKGAAQSIVCSGDTEILFPRAFTDQLALIRNINPSNTFHLYIHTNGHIVTFGSGYSFEDGDPGVLTGFCHANFILNHEDKLSGVVLLNVLDPTEVLIQI